MEKNNMIVKAINKNVRTSPRKLSLVCNFIKGKKVELLDLEKNSYNFDNAIIDFSNNKIIADNVNIDFNNIDSYDLFFNEEMKLKYEEIAFDYSTVSFLRTIKIYFNLI